MRCSVCGKESWTNDHVPLGVGQVCRPCHQQVTDIMVGFIKDWREGRLTAEEVCQILNTSLESRGAFDWHARVEEIPPKTVCKR